MRRSLEIKQRLLAGQSCLQRGEKMYISLAQLDSGGKEIPWTVCYYVTEIFVGTASTSVGVERPKPSGILEYILSQNLTSMCNFIFS